MFQTIVLLRPYFFSLREIGKNVSLDMKIPATWTYEFLLKESPSVEVKVQDSNAENTLISLISTANNNGYESVVASAKKLIKVNKEEQEKMELFQKMVNQLQTIFKSESLEKIKELNFLKENEQQHSEEPRMVGEGETEGPSGDSEA